MKGIEESQFNEGPRRTSAKHVFDNIFPVYHTYRGRKWEVEIGDKFESEFDALPEDVQDEILAHSLLLQEYGPQLGRPRVDTLNGSHRENMKELRRHAILLVAGDKSGGSEKRFYNELIRKADTRFDAHLGRLRKERK
jgi:hypothetical protein